MLHLLYGPAASGKTDLLMGRIRAAVAARTPGQVLLVPEQYSHEAERALCAACGDSLSLYAEVLSFTGLARVSRRCSIRAGGCCAWRWRSIRSRRGCGCSVRLPAGRSSRMRAESSGPFCP